MTGVGEPVKASGLKDVAARAGVSIATAARVLRGDPRLAVRPETRTRVLRAAAEIDYRPNRLASGLRTRRAGTIALFLPDPRNVGWSDMVTGIEETVVASDSLLAIADVRGPNVHPDIFARFVLERRVDGVLIAVGLLDEDLVARLAARGMPMVPVNGRSGSVSGSVILPDEAGAALAIDHLARHGHRRIGHVTGRPAADVAQRRERGYRDAMTRLGLPIDPAWIARGAYTEAGARQATAAMLALPAERRPTAILSTNLTLGLGARTAARDARLRVPHDLSLVTFDNHPIEEHLDPPMTAIDMPMRAMGAMAAQMLFDAIAGTPIRHLVVPDAPALVVRASTSAPPLAA